MKTKSTCNQCQEQMTAFLFDHKADKEQSHIVTVCTNAACPNYSLMQASVEKMLELSKSLSKK